MEPRDGRRRRTLGRRSTPCPAARSTTTSYGSPGPAAPPAAPRTTRPIRGNTAPTFPARSEEHTSELQSLMRISYAVFCLKKKNKTHSIKTSNQTQIQNYNTTSNKQKQPHITNISSSQK